MTGPNEDPRTGVPAEETPTEAEPAPPPVTATAPPEGQVARVPPNGASSPTGPTSWVAPDPPPGRSPLRGCAIALAIVGAVLGVLAIFGIVVVIFLGGQIQSILRGTVQFGTGGEGCSVEAPDDSFAVGKDLHFVAWLERDVAVGETITLIQTYPDGTSDPASQTADSAASCMFGGVVAGPATGHYTVEVLVGTESLAKGAFDVTP